MWKNGRQLATASTGHYTLSFEYNDEGIRTLKTVDGVDHNYHLSNSLVITEEWGNNLIIYLYDAEGTPIGMQYRNTSYAEGAYDTYWFEKNLQGDIVAVYSETGTKLIAYTYDAWGNFSTTYYNGGASTTATYNPFRYRGYYYDVELGFYYLNSRYYDPAIGRFINPDDVSLLGANGDFASLNLYAYCGNNPVARADDGGEFWVTLGKAVLGAAISAGIDLAVQLVCNGGNIEEVDWWSVGKSAVGGAVSSLIGTGASYLASKTKDIVLKSAIPIVSDGISNLASDFIAGDINSVQDAMYSTLDGMLMSCTKDYIKNDIVSHRADKISNMSRGAQKNFITNNIFKKGNLYFNWNFRTYKNQQMYKDYLNKGIGVFDKLFDNGISFVKGVIG